MSEVQRARPVEVIVGGDLISRRPHRAARLEGERPSRVRCTERLPIGDREPPTCAGERQPRSGRKPATGSTASRPSRCLRSMPRSSRRGRTRPMRPHVLAASAPHRRLVQVPVLRTHGTDPSRSPPTPGHWCRVSEICSRLAWSPCVHRKAPERRSSGSYDKLRQRREVRALARQESTDFGHAALAFDHGDRWVAERSGVPDAGAAPELPRGGHLAPCATGLDPSPPRGEHGRPRVVRDRDHHDA